MTERETQKQIVEYLRRIGYLVIVTSTNRAQAASIAGMPDIVAVKDNATIFIEVKSADGRLSNAQVAFTDAISVHLGPNLKCIVARNLDDVLAITGGN